MSKPPVLLATLCASACVLNAARAAQATPAIPTSHTARSHTARAPRATPLARAAHALKASDTAHLRYLSASGSLLLEEGQTSGTLPGKMRAHVDVGSTFTGNFTTYTRYGTITGHGKATPHGSGRYESFSGTLVVTGGSGRYAHAHGTAGLYGTFDRDNYAFVVQTTGTLLY
jgi:hypothetical protein